MTVYTVMMETSDQVDLSSYTNELLLDDSIGKTEKKRS